MSSIRATAPPSTPALTDAANSRRTRRSTLHSDSEASRRRRHRRQPGTWPRILACAKMVERDQLLDLTEQLHTPETMRQLNREIVEGMEELMKLLP